MCVGLFRLLHVFTPEVHPIHGKVPYHRLLHVVQRCLHGIEVYNMRGGNNLKHNPVQPTRYMRYTFPF